ncbi:hypothetical protein L1887_19505 [Cichorium endivia]|nr:hypothetical protein L1887_19505 [Cichorium endivia]
MNSQVSSMDEDGDSSFDYMVFDSSSKLIPNGFMRSDCTVKVVHDSLLFLCSFFSTGSCHVRICWSRNYD